MDNFQYSQVMARLERIEHALEELGNSLPYKKFYIKDARPNGNHVDRLKDDVDITTANADLFDYACRRRDSKKLINKPTSKLSKEPEKEDVTPEPSQQVQNVTQGGSVCNPKKEEKLYLTAEGMRAYDGSKWV